MRFDRRERRIIPTGPKPFRFGLRTVFLVLTAVCLWLAIATWEPMFAVGAMALAGALLWHRGQLHQSTLQMALGAILAALAVLGGPMIFDLLGRL